MPSDPHPQPVIPTPPTRTGARQAALAALWRGLLMGTADVVPGVSGGTMALVLGIYPRLLAALAAWTQGTLWRQVAQRDLRAAWTSIDGPFMLGLVTGIAAAVISLAGLVETALTVARPQVYALFGGLIMASALLLAAAVRRWSLPLALLLLLSAGLALLLVQLAPLQAPAGAGFLVLSGAIGISALILPGISGAFLLMLLGQYEVVLGAIARVDLPTLAPFALGAVLGLFSFARFLHYGWRRYPNATHAAMTGFLVGSLPRVWPWQPSESGSLVLLTPPSLIAALLALALAILGVGLVVGLQRQAQRQQRVP